MCSFDCCGCSGKLGKPPFACCITSTGLSAVGTGAVFESSESTVKSSRVSQPGVLDLALASTFNSSRVSQPGVLDLALASTFKSSRVSQPGVLDLTLASTFKSSRVSQPGASELAPSTLLCNSAALTESSQSRQAGGSTACSDCPKQWHLKTMRRRTPARAETGFNVVQQMACTLMFWLF